nr:PREDICTED: AT-rich interactive domain-containing protein 2 isoform X2 [Bemisia tabaci]
MAHILRKDPDTYRREKESFLRDLVQFHDTRGTAFRRTPKINGKEIDLFLLYNLVTSNGGWVKVNSRNEWEDLLVNFNVPKNCVNSSVALKQIYLRFLDRYEKVHFLGETGDHGDVEDEDSRHRKWSARAFNSVPLTYNYHQHNITDAAREVNGFSKDLYRPSEYDKLALSILSPLPNEQDFAINVCTLLSNEGKHTLKLEKHPRILHCLLAHAAVFNHQSMRDFFEDHYKNVRGHSVKHFWSDVLGDKALLPLLNESKFVRRKKGKLLACEESKEKEEPIKMDVEADSGLVDLANSADKTSDDTDVEEVDCDSGSESKCKINLKITDDDKELFCVGRTLGMQDYVGQRVLQIAMVLRNLSFTEENLSLLSSDVHFIRFMLLCCGANWDCLHQVGHDMLANVAVDVKLEEPFVDHVLRVVNNGIHSQDRAVILSSIEILNKLGQNEDNEELLQKCLQQKVYERICSFLTLHDIMLLVYTLECLYSLSSLGERACNAIMHVHGAIDTLVSLVTVEAQSYGPKACILMRVVETVSGGTSMMSMAPTAPPPTPIQPSSYPPSPYPPSSFPSSFPSPLPPIPSSLSGFTSSPGMYHPIPSSSPSLVSSPMPLPFPMTPAVASFVATTSMPVSQTTTLVQSGPSHPPPLQPTQVTPQPVPKQMIQTRPPQPMGSTAASIATVSPVGVSGQLVAQENEQFAIQWLRNHFEPSTVPGRGIEQGELYKQYITACARVGRKGVIAPGHFPQCVKTVFGANVGPKEVIAARANANGDLGSTTSLFIYEGIQVRGKPPLAPNILPGQLPSSPILKAQLSAPPKPNASPPPPLTPIPSTIVKKDIKTKVSTHPHLSQALLNAGQQVQTQTTCAIGTLVTTATSSVPVASTSANAATPEVTNSNTSLIKSLLANKVCEIPSSSAHSMAANTATPCEVTNVSSTVGLQVVQRQQQAKMLQQQQQQQQTSQPQVVTQQQPAQSQQLILQQQLLQPQQQVQVQQPNQPPAQQSVPQPQVQQPQTSQPLQPVGQQPQQVSVAAAPVKGQMLSRINGARQPVQQMEMNVNQRSDIDTSEIPFSTGTTSIVISSGMQTQAPGSNNNVKLVIENHGKGPPQPNSPGAKSETSETSNQIAATVPLDQNNCVSSTAYADANETPTISIAESENSLSSFDNLIVNGVPNSLNVDSLTNKTISIGSLSSPNKSLMLADLLEKTIEKNDPPVLNGALRISDKGLELVDKEDGSNKSINEHRSVIKKTISTEHETVIVNSNNNSSSNNNVSSNPSNEVKQNGSKDGADSDKSSCVIVGTKRPSSEEISQDEPKRPHINGNKSPSPEPTEESEVKASSTAANLYAALAADLLSDSEDDPPAPQQPAPPQTPPVQQVMLAQGGGHRGIIVAAAPGSMPQRVVMGQQYVLAQPQTALVQGQTQTVLVAQTSQQQGTGSKTIIILHPQGHQISANSPGQQQQIQGQIQSQPMQQHTTTGIQSPVVLQSSQQPPTKILVSRVTTMTQNPAQQSIVTVPTQTSFASNAPIMAATATPQIRGIVSTVPEASVATGAVTVASAGPPPSVSPAPGNIILNKQVINKVIKTVGQSVQSYQLTSVGATPTTATVPSPSVPVAPSRVTPMVVQNRGQPGQPDGHFLCEWRGCMRNFKSANEVYMHACEAHCPSGTQEIQCLWERCDAMKRRRFSLMTHLYDRHCNPDVLRMMAVRRKQLSQSGRSEIPPPPPPAPHPGYAPNAAFHAIKRHALEFVNPKELQDDNEGPVTKSIRLTSALILRNLVIYSTSGKRNLTRYEPHLASVALSNVESSRTIAQVLYDMSQQQSSPR